MDMKKPFFGWKEAFEERESLGEDADKKKWDLQKWGMPRLCLLVAAGVVLLLTTVPGKDEKKKETEHTEERYDVGQESQEWEQTAMDLYVQKKEKELQQLLSKAEGVGEVDVMLTLAASGERITLQNDAVSEENTVEETEEKTNSRQSLSSESVLIQKEGEQMPYLVQFVSPKIEGVAVVAQGADGGSMDTKIIEMVQALFPVEAHKIRVMKRK